MSNHGYNHFRIPVPTEYSEVFSHFYFAENKSDETISKTLLPSFQTILIFSFGSTPFLHAKDKTTIPVEKCLMIGPIKQAFDYSLPPNAEILTVNFIADSFYRFFGDASIAEHVPIEPDTLLDDGCFNLLWNEIYQMKNKEDRTNHILKFCDPYLSYRNKNSQTTRRLQGTKCKSD